MSACLASRVEWGGAKCPNRTTAINMVLFSYSCSMSPWNVIYSKHLKERPLHFSENGYFREKVKVFSWPCSHNNQINNIHLFIVPFFYQKNFVTGLAF
jgi:hypothetical protein